MSRIKGLTGYFSENTSFYPESRIYFPLNHKLSSLNIHRKSTNCNPVHPKILVILIWLAPRYAIRQPQQTISK
jgi:hypothetical protein